MSILDELNEEQRKAAEKIDGPVLILAGAGSGKTRTVTYRIAHMIKEKGISPLNIMALTFTNKAAKEMKERAEALIGPDANNLVVSTFHSFSVRLLKTYSDRIGYGRNFNIYDVDDQKTIINKIKKDIDYMYRKHLRKQQKNLIFLLFFIMILNTIIFFSHITSISFFNTDYFLHFIS